MTKSPHAALISVPPFDRALLQKLPGLLSDLGPVKASSTRTASRAANALRAGYPVRDWADLRDSEFLLVSAPPEKLDALVGEMTAALGAWRRRTVVLVGGSLDTPGSAALVRRGAHVAAIHLLESSLEPLAVVEGNARAVREIRRRMPQGPRLIVSPRRAAEACRLAAATLQLSLPAALDGAASLLRRAGLSPPQAWRVVDSYAQFTLRAFRRGGRRTVRDLQSDSDRREVAEQVLQLRSGDPELADFVVEILAASLRHRGMDPGWLAADGKARTAAE